MKKQIYTFIGLIIVLTISSLTSIHAQTATTVRAHIPFEFSVRDKTMTAGDYVINRQYGASAVWSVFGGKNRQSSVLLVMNVEPKRIDGNAKLTFHRYGNKYFLAEMETSDYKVGLPKSRTERALQKSLKQNNRIGKNNSNGTAPEIVAIDIAM